MSARADDKCPNCGHPWGSHQQAASSGDECVYRRWADDRCGCRQSNPISVAERRLAARAWNGFMGRTQ